MMQRLLFEVEDVTRMLRSQADQRVLRSSMAVRGLKVYFFGRPPKYQQFFMNVGIGCLERPFLGRLLGASMQTMQKTRHLSNILLL